MNRLRMALPVSFLLVSLTLPSIGQTSDDSRKESLVSMQTQSQVSNAPASTADHQLSGEETGDLYMARKQYTETTEHYRSLSPQDPPNTPYLNTLRIAL